MDRCNNGVQRNADYELHRCQRSNKKIIFLELVKEGRKEGRKVASGAVVSFSLWAIYDVMDIAL